MTDTREAARQLLALAREKKVRFPSIWDETKLFQTCGATILLFRNEDGGFNLEEGVNNLIEKFGAAPTEAPEKSKAKGTKRKKDTEDDEAEEKEGDEDAEDEEGGKKKSKKPKAPPKTSIVAEESNRKVAEAIKEMADIYFKNKDMRKGGVFSKAAKAIRECETPITTAKEAMALKGIGKGIAGYIEEFLQKGEIQKLEELRAGIA